MSKFVFDLASPSKFSRCYLVYIKVRPVFPAQPAKLTNAVPDYHVLASSPPVLTHIALKLTDISFTHYSKTRLTTSSLRSVFPRRTWKIQPLDWGLIHPAPRHESGSDSSPNLYHHPLGTYLLLYFVSQTTVAAIFFLPPISSHSACSSSPCFFLRSLALLRS